MTKRKNSRIDPNNRFRHTQPPFHAPPIPSSQFYFSISTPNSPTRKDIGCQKKVKFAAPEKDSSRSCRLEDSYRPAERGKVATCSDTDPKTSEYAFFKKLKKDVGLGFGLHPLQKDADHSRKHESSDHSKGRTADVRVGNRSSNSSRIIEDMSTVKTDSFISPPGGAWNKSDAYSISSMRKSSQACGDTFKPQENQCMHGEIFSRKRQKLHQSVADALFLDKEKFCSKGHDIISMLLNRLFPMSIQENKYEDPNPGKGVKATGYDLLDSHGSVTQLKEHHHQTPTRKLLGLEPSSYFSDHLLSPMLLSSDERITSHAEFPTSHFHKYQPLTKPECKFGGNPSISAKSDVTLGFLYNEPVNATSYGLLDPPETDVRFQEHYRIPKTKILELELNSYVRDHLLSPSFLRSNERIIPHADLPTSHSHSIQPLDSITESEYEFGGTPSFSAKRDVTLGFLFNEQEHETFTSNYFIELGELKREPIPLPVYKDFDCTCDEINLPISYEYAKANMVPSLSTLGNGEEKMLRNILGEYQFSPSSLLLEKPQPRTFNSMLDSGLLRYQEFRFGKYVYEDKDDKDMNFNHTALSLSHNKHYFKLSEDCKNDTNTSCVQDSIYLSPYQHWIRRVSNDYHHHRPDTETWLTSSLDFISGRRCLSLTSSHSNHQSSNSSTLQRPQVERMSSLFDSNDNYEPEMDSGNHSEVLYHFREDLIGIYNSSFLRMSMQSDNGWPFPMDSNDYINEQEQMQKMLRV